MKKSWFGVDKFWGFYPKTIEGLTLVILMFTGVVLITILGSNASLSIIETVINSFPGISFIVSATILLALYTGAKPAFGKNKSENYNPDNPKVYLLLPIVSLVFTLFYLIEGRIFDGMLFSLTTLVLVKIYRDLNIEKEK